MRPRRWTRSCAAERPRQASSAEWWTTSRTLWWPSQSRATRNSADTGCPRLVRRSVSRAPVRPCSARKTSSATRKGAPELRARSLTSSATLRHSGAGRSSGRPFGSGVPAMGTATRTSRTDRGTDGRWNGPALHALAAKEGPAPSAAAPSTRDNKCRRDSGRADAGCAELTSLHLTYCRLSEPASPVVRPCERRRCRQSPHRRLPLLLGRSSRLFPIRSTHDSRKLVAQPMRTAADRACAARNTGVWPTPREYSA